MSIYLVIPPKLAVTLYFTFYDKYITIWHLCNAEQQQQQQQQQQQHILTFM